MNCARYDSMIDIAAYQVVDSGLQAHIHMVDSPAHAALEVERNKAWKGRS
jgi:hypothetical protein